MDTLWRIELFDGLRAQRGEICLTRFRTQKTAALLAYLAFFPVAHTREFLIELLWPNTSLETGRNNLRLALASLRRQFEPPGKPQGSVLITGRVWVQLHPQSFTTDVQEFEIRLHDAAKAPLQASKFWKQALDCYKGPLLRGHYEDWIPVEEQRLENLMLRSTQNLIEFCEAQKDIEKAQYYAHKAARVSRDTETRLRAHRLLRRNEKNLISDKQAYSQPNIVTPAAKTPTLISPLPMRLTRFFGRHAEIERILNFLNDPQTRLITVSGPGGCGKTRLALEIAWRRQETYPQEAICFVPLADLPDPDFIADAIAQALHLPSPLSSSPTTLQPAIDRVIETLQQKGNCLLVLDNFEQLLPGGNSVVQQIINSVPALHCLLTSRTVLQLPGEQEFPLTSLEMPPLEIDNLAQLQEFDAVQLFADRARARRPDFQITPHNAQSLSELLRRLDCLPLAIEICAARSNVLSPHQMLSQLKSGGELAGDTRLGLAMRHNSLRAAFDWSYSLLASGLQCALRHIALFRGGFSLEAAQAVCGNIPILSSLAFLRDASLVQSEEIVSVWGHSEMRFSLLDTILLFAYEKLSIEESIAAHERHALYYVELGEATINLSIAFTSEIQQVLLAELENFSVALQWSIDKRLDLAMRLIVVLESFWAAYNPARGRAMLENVVKNLRKQALSSASSSTAHARILRECGEMAVRQMDLTNGKSWIEESLHLSGQNENQSEAAACFNSLGLIALEENDYQKAHDFLEKSCAIYRTMHDAKGIAWTLRHQGVLARRTSNFEVARACFNEGLQLFQSVGDRSGKTWILLACGELEIEEGHLKQAEELCSHAENTFRLLGHKTGLLWALHCCGDVAWKQGNNEQARLLFAECLTLANQLQNQTAIDVVTISLQEISV